MRMPLSNKSSNNVLSSSSSNELNQSNIEDESNTDIIQTVKYL